MGYYDPVIYKKNKKTIIAEHDYTQTLPAEPYWSVTAWSGKPHRSRLLKSAMAKKKGQARKYVQKLKKVI